MDSKEVELLYKEAKARREIIILVSELEKENEELKKDKKLLLSDYEGLLKDKRLLEEENKRLTERNRELFDDIIDTDVRCRKLKKESEDLKKKLILTENNRDEWKLKAENLWEKNNELKEKLECEKIF